MPKIVMKRDANCRSADHKEGDKVARKKGDEVNASDHDAWYLCEVGIAKALEPLGPTKTSGLSTRNGPTGKKKSKK